MRALFACVLSIFASVTIAEDLPHYFTPDQIKIGSVTLEDNATNGCWTNLKESREYLEEQFRLNGYKLMDEDALVVPEEERRRVGDIVRSLVSEAPQSVVKSAYLTMLQGNRYDANIKVHATRSKAGLCIGTIRVSIQRILVGHHEDVVYTVDVDYLDNIYSQSGNLNIEVLDLAKSFVKYLQTGKVE